MKHRRAYNCVGNLATGGFEERVVMELNFQSTKDLHYTLKLAMKRLAETEIEMLEYASDSVIEDDELDVPISVAMQSVHNEEVTHLIEGTIANIERVFPSLKGCE